MYTSLIFKSEANFFFIEEKRVCKSYRLSVPTSQSTLQKYVVIKVREPPTAGYNFTPMLGRMMLTGWE